MFSRPLVTSAIVLCGWMIVSPVTSLVAQQSVCVVDVAEIFRNHAGFNQQIENLKQQAEQYKFELQRQGEQLQLRSERLKDFQIGSPEYKALETELAQASANLEVDRRSKTRDFVQTEAQLHFDTYVQVTQLIAQLCEQRGYRMALRFDGSSTDSANPESIMQRVNEYVIFHQPGIDITAEIIRALNADAPRVGNIPPATQGR
jgi:Skp family chaperone for outer membrane proteins